MDTTIERSALEGKLLPELQQIAQTLGVEGTQKLRKAGLIDAIVAASTNGEGSRPATAMRPRGPRPHRHRSTTTPAEGRDARSRMRRDRRRATAPEPSAGNEREGRDRDRNDAHRPATTAAHRNDRGDRQGAPPGRAKVPRTPATAIAGAGLP